MSEYVQQDDPHAHEHQHSRCCGCGFADPEAVKRARYKTNEYISVCVAFASVHSTPMLPCVLVLYSEAKKDEIPLDERNVKKLAAVEATREHGNILFKEGKFNEACAVYERVSARLIILILLQYRCPFPIPLVPSLHSLTVCQTPGASLIRAVPF